MPLLLAVGSWAFINTHRRQPQRSVRPSIARQTIFLPVLPVPSKEGSSLMEVANCTAHPHPHIPYVLLLLKGTRPFYPQGGADNDSKDGCPGGMGIGCQL